jgi:hypothetical protein
MPNNICQIAISGGNVTWQKLGLKEIPETKWLILLSNAPEEPMNFLEEAQELKKEIEDNQKEFPSEYKLKVSVLDLTEIDNNYNQLIGYFKHLFEIIIEKGYKICINASSGLQIWKLALYQNAIMFKEHIDKFFIFNKKSKKMDIIWIQSDLDGNDKILLEAIAKYKELSMKDLQAEYERIMDKGTLSYMVKLVDKLEKMNLIVTKKSGRVKYISLNEIGENMILNKSLKTELLNKLN